MSELFSVSHTVARFLQTHHLASAFSEREAVSLQIIKIQEEIGEAAQAWINALGQNPTKGVVGRVENVAGELCDVIVTATVALISLLDAMKEYGGDDAEGFLNQHLLLIEERYDKLIVKRENLLNALDEHARSAQE